LSGKPRIGRACGAGGLPGSGAIESPIIGWREKRAIFGLISRSSRIAERVAENLAADAGGRGKMASRLL
jgi:hypothetical protein